LNQWLHIKIVVSGKSAEIYIKDMDTPALSVNEMKRDVRPGRVGLSVANFAPAHFSNFSFTVMDRPALKGQAKIPTPTPAGTVLSWLVSDPFDAKSLDNKYELRDADQAKLRWRTLTSENNGTANLARLQGVAEGRNTVFVKVKIRSDNDQIKKVKFGFSDAVKVYCNQRLIYGGSDVYRSRDHRFLGTIGLFDELYLPLRKGDNDLLLAVTENFGGWGVKAFFDDMQGITFGD